MKDYWLSQICAALGWQGGTIHQVIAEIERTRAALESARNGLQWYRDTYPEADSGADDEMMEEIAAILGSERAMPAAEAGGPAT